MQKNASADRGGAVRDLDQGHGRAAGDHVHAAGAAEGERRGPGPGDDHQGR